jgi:RHS repeat-associated protein
VFDGIDHPLRIRQGATVAYYELDLAGNVRGLRASGGADLGGYRFSAFGSTKDDTATIQQPLKWKGRWASGVAGGIYDVRARQWAPEIGVFMSIDGYEFHEPNTTLWSWPNENPVRFNDPTGNQTSPYRDQPPLPPGVLTCGRFFSKGTPGRALCCQLVCAAHATGHVGGVTVYSGHAYASCMTSCDPGDPFPMCK